eukprot:comp7280_c0_seq1/m.2987 comp7280_c0_seq1/g.2987  ORF comp7280_c0_seq1/g.2987 comp7280_c0_seq1/m.2987 type:complete len:273 (-) comp7280_c0_seq1:372-1190(-)
MKARDKTSKSGITLEARNLQAHSVSSRSVSRCSRKFSSHSITPLSSYTSLSSSDDAIRFPKVTIAVLGAQGVGKTCLVERFVDGVNFKLGEQYTTIEDTYDHLVMAEEGTYELQILDTAGKIASEDLKSFYLKRAQGFLLVCSADNPDSLSHIITLRQDIDAAKPHAPVAVVLTKGDVADQHTSDHAKAWAAAQNIEYSELSILFNGEDSIHAPFHTLVHLCATAHDPASVTSPSAKSTSSAGKAFANMFGKPSTPKDSRKDGFVIMPAGTK